MKIIQYGNYWVSQELGKFTVNGTDGVLWDNLSLREAVKRARRLHRINFAESNRLGIDGYEACEWSPH